MRLVSLSVAPLGEDALGAFGWLPVPDTDSRDALHRLRLRVGRPEPQRDRARLRRGRAHRRELQYAVMYRHDTHTQAFTPLNVPSVVAVAPASLHFSDVRHLDEIHAFPRGPLDSSCCSPERGTGDRSRSVRGTGAAPERPGCRATQRTNTSVDLPRGPVPRSRCVTG